MAYTYKPATGLRSDGATPYHTQGLTFDQTIEHCRVMLRGSVKLELDRY
jgi:hypothetical protein